MTNRVTREFLNRRDFLGGGGGGGGDELEDPDGSLGGGRDVGGAVWLLPPGGGGGTNGTFSGGIVVSELGVTGDDIVGETEATGPGGSGVASDAVWLRVPGKTIASESCMLGFVFGSGVLALAYALCSRRY